MISVRKDGERSRKTGAAKYEVCSEKEDMSIVQASSAQIGWGQMGLGYSAGPLDQVGLFHMQRSNRV